MEEGMLSTQTLTLNGGRTRFGCGTVTELPNAVRSLGHHRALLVTDNGVVGAGIASRVEAILRDGGIDVVTFDGVVPNPSTETLDSGAGVARAFGAGAVIALGGGSVIDTAKGLALMATNRGVASDFDYRNAQEHAGAPIVALPTTAGTGAETNGFGVIDNHVTGRKFYVGHDTVTPRSVILDPDLTVGLPAGPTAACGMDVVTHAVESLSARQTNPYADGLNLQVVATAVEYLPRAVADGTDIEARAQMLLAAHMTALAFATTGLGMGHALAHALSARCGVAHGVVLSILLPHVVAFNLPVREEVYSRLATALDPTRAGDPAACVDAVRTLGARAGMPRALGDLGVEPAIFPQVVEDALADEVMLNTPRRPEQGELRVLLSQAL
jgi:alcohol dehydrogenase class IV